MKADLTIAALSKSDSLAITFESESYGQSQIGHSWTPVVVAATGQSVGESLLLDEGSGGVERELEVLSRNGNLGGSSSLQGG